MTSDPDRSRDFYHRLFGWTSEDAGPEYGGYVNFSRDGDLVAGCMRDQGQGAPDTWSIYLTSDDAAKTVEAATGSGAQVIVPPMDVMELGTMAFVADPAGAGIGVWQPGLHQGFGVFGEPGSPGWFELHTRDYDASVGFYRDVFRWDTHVQSDVPEFRYTTYGDGDDRLAGIMDASAFLPAGAPASWSIYFAVDDTDGALTRIVELGGSVVMGAEDTPYGRLAQAADPTGTRFKLVAGG
jgi:uncharacterized protein